METLCKLLYRPFKTEHGYGKELVRCVPHEGVWLYQISATYSDQIPCAQYYYLGRTEKEALMRFKNTMPWLKVKSIQMIPPGDQAECILTDRLRMPKR